MGREKNPLHYSRYLVSISWNDILVSYCCLTNHHILSSLKPHQLWFCNCFSPIHVQVAWQVSAPCFPELPPRSRQWHSVPKLREESTPQLSQVPGRVKSLVVAGLKSTFKWRLSAGGALRSLVLRRGPAHLRASNDASNPLRAWARRYLFSSPLLPVSYDNSSDCKQRKFSAFKGSCGETGATWIIQEISLS